MRAVFTTLSLTLVLHACGPLPQDVADANDSDSAADAVDTSDDADAETAIDDASTPADAETAIDDASTPADASPDASDASAPSCRKHVTLTVALYTSMQNPGEDGIPDTNGCWSYERVAKYSAAWKVCISTGEVSHPNGMRWVFDDTNPRNDYATELAAVRDCARGVPERGYVYMAARDGLGWRRTGGRLVSQFFAELYSSQSTVDDLFAEWARDRSVGAPMVNVGIAGTSPSHIHDSVLRACRNVHDGGHVGIYVYPTALQDARARAVVQALNECTGL